MFGLKIYTDREKSLTQEIIEKTVENNLSTEIFLISYITRKKIPFEEVKWILEETPFSEIGDKTYHLDNIHTYGSKLEDKETYDSFVNEMEDAKRLGIDKTVMHYSECYPAEALTHSKIVSDLKLIQKLAADNDTIVHIENTLFQDGRVNVDFHRVISREVLEAQHENIGFCFDLGHGKALSVNTLPEWLVFLDELKQSNAPLHFHLHNNDSETDLHLSFREAEERGFNKGDKYSAGRHYLEVIADIEKNYPGSKIFEVKPEEAVPHMNWLKEQNII